MTQGPYSQNGVVNPYVPEGLATFTSYGPKNETLFSMAQSILDTVKQTFTSHGVPLPGREVVYMSPIPADCEQVAVLFSGWGSSSLTEGPQNCQGYLWSADFSVIVTRCSPAVAPSTSKSLVPEAAKMVEAAAIASRDAEVFLDVLVGLGPVASPQITVLPPMGGFQTAELTFNLVAGSI